MSKRTTKYYRKNEAEVMKRLGFRPTKNSGAGWVEKEDGENEVALCQLKSTDNESISVKQKDLYTLDCHSSISHKIPVFAIQFLSTGETWCMVKEDVLKDIMQLYLEKYDLSEQKQEFLVDKEEEKSYNTEVNRNARDIQKARENYHKQREGEKEKIKEEIKRRKRECGKRFQTKRNSFI